MATEGLLRTTTSLPLLLFWWMVVVVAVFVVIAPDDIVVDVASNGERGDGGESETVMVTVE